MNEASAVLDVFMLARDSEKDKIWPHQFCVLILHKLSRVSRFSARYLRENRSVIYRELLVCSPSVCMKGENEHA